MTPCVPRLAAGDPRSVALSAVGTASPRRTPPRARRTRTRARSSSRRAATHRPRSRCCGRPRDWRRMMPTFRTGSAKRSSGWAPRRRRRRLPPRGVRAPGLSARPLNNLILTLVKAGKGPEAVERARAFVAQAPDDPNRHFTLGLAQSEQDVDQAIASFRRVLEIDPRHTLARYNLALVLKRADRLPEAIATLQRAIEIEPRAEAHYTLGVIYWQQGDLDRARARARRRRGGRAAIRRCALHARRGPVRRGATGRRRPNRLRRAIALQPDLAGAHDTLARVLQRSGDEAGGRAHFAEAERLRRRAQLEQEASVWTAVGTQKLDDGRSGRRPRSVPARDGGVRRLRARALPDGPGAPAARPARRVARGVRQGGRAQPQPRFAPRYAESEVAANQLIRSD